MSEPVDNAAIAAGKIVKLARSQTALDGPRVALIGTLLPKKCGIATFTTDIFEQLTVFHPDIVIDRYALDDPAAPLAYDTNVRAIAFNDGGAYRAAARTINESAADVVWLQHEFGIFGGMNGSMVCDFVDRLAAPLIVTLHTVLSEPLPQQRAVIEHLIARASRIMVMSKHSRDLLARVYHAPSDMIDVIEHGAPDRPFGRQEAFKDKLGLSGKTVLMTFGLLGPGKGLERVIEALPAITAAHPEVVYRIVGATHPNLVAQSGETYRDKLVALADDLDVAQFIEWDNRFLATDELLDQLEACDIYVTPYFNMQQSTSGTLSYAVALGKAVVSTPYVHARELLDNDVGLLIEPNSASALADAITGLLDTPERLRATQVRAYQKGRETIWPCFADAGAALISRAVAARPARLPITATPGLSGFFAMSDATGMLQHAIGIIPDRAHGYCVDDNARALMLMNVASGLSDAERLHHATIFAAFIQSSWNDEAGKFRNFLGFDRQWLETEGSEDSNGRAFWALGHTIEHGQDADLRAWAVRWYDTVLPRLGHMVSPRTLAFLTLGAAARLRAEPEHEASREVLCRGADTLLRLLAAERRPDWAWFEVVLGYDNPRLCQALIEAATLLDRPELLTAGLETLEWIARQQTSTKGYFRPIGSDSFGEKMSFLPFDQQPIEAQAAIEAARIAYATTNDSKWVQHAQAAWYWFFGANDRGAVLADLATGRCRDGITPHGANANCGAESILALQLSFYSMLAMMADRRGGGRGEIRESHTGNLR